MCYLLSFDCAVVRETCVKRRWANIEICFGCSILIFRRHLQTVRISPTNLTLAVFKFIHQISFNIVQETYLQHYNHSILLSDAAFTAANCVIFFVADTPFWSFWLWVLGWFGFMSELDSYDRCSWLLNYSIFRAYRGLLLY